MANIAITLIDHAGSDLSTVNSARVSYDKHHESFDDVKDTKLINYLADHKHLSPFNHAWASFRVSAPVFVARQLVKHEYLVWNEVSRRYVDDDPEFFSPPSWRSRPTESKQGSGDPIALQDNCDDILEDVHRVSMDAYKKLLANGVAPEQARVVLPHTLMTSWYWSGTLGAFAKMCNLRCKPDTQVEAQVVANAIDEEMSKLFSVSWEALRNERKSNSR